MNNILISRLIGAHSEEAPVSLFYPPIGTILGDPTEGIINLLKDENKTVSFQIGHLGEEEYKWTVVDYEIITPSVKKTKNAYDFIIILYYAPVNS